MNDKQYAAYLAQDILDQNEKDRIALAEDNQWLIDHQIFTKLSLIDQVNATVAETHEGMHGIFGSRKVFISHVYDQLATSLSLAEFKLALIELNKTQQLCLCRADMVAAMDAQLVADSEIEYLNASFHFIEK